MKRILSIALLAAMLLSLGITAYADSHYTMYIEGTEKTVYEGNQPASYTASGDCNTKLYRLLDAPSMDRSLFDSMTIDFVDDDQPYLTATRQIMVGNNGFTYESTNPEAAFFDTAGVYHATGVGESEMIVLNANGEELDRFTVKVGGAKKNYSLEALCSHCGEDMGESMHLYSCGHFVCEEGSTPMAHVAGACGRGGHFVCDGKDHSLCSNCLSYKCTGDHGVGVCVHVHSWFYANSANYWPYWEPGIPMRICTTCGVRDYAWAPPAPHWSCPHPPAPPKK